LAKSARSWFGPVTSALPMPAATIPALMYSPIFSAEPGLFAWLEELAQTKHQQGIEQGIEQAIYRTLTDILRHRLGEIPLAVDERRSISY